MGPPRWLAGVVLAAAACTAGEPATSRSPDGCPEERQRIENVATIRFRSERASLDVNVEVADEPEERRRGLMCREDLPAGRGMLFVFDDVATRSFWMRNTLVPLELAVVRAGLLVEVLSLAPCEADPCPITRTAQADRALELPPGTLARAGIDVGARVERLSDA